MFCYTCVYLFVVKYDVSGNKDPIQLNYAMWNGQQVQYMYLHANNEFNII